MSEERKKSGATFWAAVWLALVLVYTLSFAPAYKYFYIRRFETLPVWQDHAFWSFYRPVIWLRAESATFEDTMRSYEKLWGIPR
jgi:hypothetical protein